MTIASQIPPQNLEPQFALNNLPLHKSHSINKFALNALQKSDSKDCEQSERLDSMRPIFDTNSNNHHKFLKLSINTTNPKIRRFLPETNSEFIC